MDAASNLLMTGNPSHEPLNVSSSELRFPIAHPDGSIGNLDEHIQPDVMLSRNEDLDEESLAGSTYEFVDTDVESRDGRATASIASSDAGRPDDVDSLADTEQSEDESEDEGHNQSSVPALRSLEQTSVLETPTIGRSTAAFYDDLDQPNPRAIEFEESFNPGANTISVKHTLEEFSVEQTEATVKALNLQNPPKHLSLTIRQTMTRSGLSAKDPLRILYVGSHAAKQDIIHKLASSLTASSTDANPRGSQPQLYSVVPMSAFRSEEVELMHSSGFQIKVEDCIDAESIPFEDRPYKPDLIKLRVDDNTSYHSVPDGKSFTVEPTWELPHVAVFYCSGGDTSESKRTRTLARKFMGRHGVPSIVITHQTILDRSLCMSLDQHSIHMCLESRDPERRGSIIRHRLPIDLSSFLNIDARQMSRNLAYITGLHDTSNDGPSSDARTLSEALNSGKRRPSKLNQLFRLSNFQDWRYLASFSILLLSITLTAFTSLPAYRLVSPPAISINSKTVQPVSIPSTTSAITSSLVPSITSIPTEQIHKVSVKTVTVTQSTGPNSLSIVPAKEVRVLPKKPAETIKSNRTICSAEILNDREILIRIPAATKLSWLGRDAISVNITRNNITVEAERAYSSNDGIILQLAKREAYGLLKLSIVTAKKPRVNDTIQVNFGTTTAQTIENVKSKVYSIIAHDILLIDQTIKKAQEVISEVVARTKASKMDEVAREAAKKASSAGQGAADAAKSLSFELARRSAIASKEVTLQVERSLADCTSSLQQLQAPVQKGILRAQVQSKLAWLKLRGKNKEYDEYKKRAFIATNAFQASKGKACKHRQKKSMSQKGSCMKKKLRS